jgi:hypothetical protein
LRKKEHQRNRGVQIKGIKERAFKRDCKKEISRKQKLLKDIIRKKEHTKEPLIKITRRKDMKKRPFEKDHKKKKNVRPKVSQP